MQEPQTWRDLLGQRIENLQERQRLAHALQVSPITLMRWVSKESTPRPQLLQRLLKAWPEEREQLLRLIREEFKDFPTLSEYEAVVETSLTIPAEFYTRVLHTLATLSRDLHFWSLCDLILRQVLLQLDPHRLGMAVIVVRCMPPSDGKMVRSLREVYGCGTPPWPSTLDNDPMFLGIESLAGYAVSTARLVENQNLGQEANRAPGYAGKWEGSAVAAPIMFAGNIAGCLLISSTQAGYFGENYYSLIEGYAELIALAFDRQEFYAPEQIALGVLPSYEVQKSSFSGFRQRTIDLMRQASINRHPITALEAEQLVWQQLEQELLQTPFR
ncbi:MAG TPA: GAF domain-containing protein [Ktedonobacteraceae bacterium]|jgi:hypothetical protein|nr:GAF domain-containing protein [Ktedonobacteraceae bacterium]